MQAVTGIGWHPARNQPAQRIRIDAVDSSPDTGLDRPETPGEKRKVVVQSASGEVQKRFYQNQFRQGSGVNRG